MPILRLIISGLNEWTMTSDQPFLRQSAHALLSGCLTKSLRIRACRSVVALSATISWLTLLDMP
jgi:hypothetical protein